MDQQTTQHRIQIANLEREYLCPTGSSLLLGMEKVNARFIAVGCRGGGCGVCKIRIVSGEYASKRMSKAQISDEEASAGMALACRVFPKGDMTIEVPEN